MKNFNFIKWFNVLFFVMSTLAFVSCVDDNDDTEAPYLTVTPTTLDFTNEGTPAAGSQSYFEISTNRTWTAKVQDNATWVTLSATSGEGDAKVEVSIPAGINNEATIIVQISNKVGPLKSETITIKSGDVKPASVIYHTNIGDASVSSPYPFVNEYDNWNATGTGITNVTYSGEKATIRATGLSNAGSYPNASGPNVVFFGTLPSYFTINNIGLTAEQTKLQLTFGASYSLKAEGSTEYDNVFKKDKFTVELSADGTSWTPLTYTINNGDQTSPYWVLATADFTLTKSVSKLFVRFTALAASAIRLDDIKLAVGNGGQSIDLDGGVTPPPTGDATVITIPEINAMMSAKPGTIIDADNDRFFEAIVQNDVAGGNYSFNNLIVATEGATTEGHGVTLYGSQVEPTVLGLTKGDKVKITLTKGLAKAENYNGMFEITGGKDDAWVKVEKIGSGVAITPIVITPSQLAAFQGMAVTIKDASTATAGEWANESAISPHTFSAAGTNFTVFCKKNAGVFNNVPFKATTGNITGLAAVNSNNGQLVPRDLADVNAFANTNPTITAVAPTSLNFTAVGGTEAVKVTVSNQGSNKLSVSGLSGILSATVNGNDVTVVAEENKTTGAINQTLKITLEGGNSVDVPVIVAAPSTGNETVITLDLTIASNYPETFPVGSTNKGVEAKTFTFDKYDYVFAGSTGAGYYQTASGSQIYLMLGKQGAYIQFPVIEGKRLAKAEFVSRNGASSKVTNAITDTEGNPVAGGESILWEQVAPYTYTYNLPSTTAGTAYRLTVTNGNNTQFTSWKLTYE